MKKIYMLSALACALMFSLTGCIEENFENPIPANDGDEIIFGARAGFEGAGAGTKTVYAGEAGYYTVDGKTFERIDWIDDSDAIQIYCPEAGGPNPSDYTVHHSKDHDTQKDYAYLSKIGDSSLSWNGDGTHHFYAMYPSQALFEGMESTLYQGIRMDGTTLHGIVPGAQPATLTQNGEHWTAAPDMKYAYMAARSTATKEDGSVSLSFVPIVTAVQIQMVLSGESIEPITIAEIQVSGNGIAGNFTADLSEDGWPSTQTYPTCVNEGEGSGAITISTWKDSKPVTINAGGSLTFTIFLRPGADYKNLKISYSPTGVGYVGKTMGSDANPVAIPRNLKTVVKGFNLPAAKKEEEIITIDASKWMTQVADEVQFKKLSVPGTGGSFSYNYKSDTEGNFRSQHTHMDIPAQWKAGIRAFEIVSDRGVSVGSILGFEYERSVTTLGTEQVTCNKNDLGITVADAMKLINKQLEDNPDECAVVIFTYQPEDDCPDRNADKYAQSLKMWYDDIDYKDKFLLYSPNLTLGEARGKILVIVRISQNNEKDGGSFSGAVTTLSGYPFLLVDGCGTAKDKWGARGYTITTDGTTIVAPDISNSADIYVEQYMQSGYIDPATHGNVRLGDMNFAYSTNVSDVSCWYHEWARVVPEQLYIDSGRLDTYSYPAMYWFESYSEKLSNAIETFKMAISDQYPAYVFVNTLSGYMATDATKGSPTYSLVPSVGDAYGGNGGDIKTLATKLNADFYQAVLSAGMEQTTGPTGVVMMDYVMDKPTEGVDYDGSYYLPGVIVANNFKFAGGNSGNTGGSTGDSNGGSGNTGGGSTDTGDPEDGGDGI